MPWHEGPNPRSSPLETAVQNRRERQLSCARPGVAAELLELMGRT